MYTPVLVSNGILSLLHQKEGWEPLPCPGLLKAQHDEQKELQPLIHEILNSMSKAKAKYFTKLDI